MSSSEASFGSALTPGVQVTAMQLGTILYSEGLGLANLETLSQFTQSTISRIGSLTKQFTAAGILLLVEEGKLSLEDRLSRFLPEVPHAAEVSIRQLLTHVRTRHVC